MRLNDGYVSKDTSTLFISAVWRKPRANTDGMKKDKSSSQPDTKGKSSSRLDARPELLEHILLVAADHCFWTCVAASRCPGEEFL